VEVKFVIRIFIWKSGWSVGGVEVGDVFPVAVCGGVVRMVEDVEDVVDACGGKRLTLGRKEVGDARVAL